MSRQIASQLLLAVLGAGAFYPQQLPAQRSATDSVMYAIPHGSDVRVWRKDRYASSRYVRGAFQSATPDAITVYSTLNARPFSLALDSVNRVEIGKRASRTDHAPLGAALGAVPGALIGFGFGTILNGLCESGPECAKQPDARVLTTIVGAAAGALLGAGISLLFPGRMRWQEVALRR